MDKTISRDDAADLDRLHGAQIRAMGGKAILPKVPARRPKSPTSAKPAVLPVDFDRIPGELQVLPNWVLWKTTTRGGKPTKIPYQPDGSEAKSNDAATWGPFEDAFDVYERGQYDGIGFMFSGNDPFTGIDLDGCRDRTTGAIAPWAREVLDRLDSYSEISPSGSGVKVFIRGRSPFASGKNLKLADEPAMGDKAAGIEVYDRLRYFAVTGQAIDGRAEIAERQAELDWLVGKFWAGQEKPAPQRRRDDRPGNPVGEDVVERCRRYIATLPPAISGQGGHNATFYAACVAVLGFGLDDDDALGVLVEYNARCEPPWSEADLLHKVRSAAQQPGERGYLRDARPDGCQRGPAPGSAVAGDRHANRDSSMPSDRQFKCYSMAELAALDLSVDYIFRNALVCDTPGVIGGREKSLKTLIGLDAAISMATFTPWLGHFEPVRSARAVYFAGEGGLTTLREYARRIAESKGYNLADVAGFFIVDEVPNLDSDRDVRAATSVLQDCEAEFAFFDPLYLMLAGDTVASNVYGMGTVLRRMLRACRDAGATPIILHHFKKSQPIGQPPELSDLSQAGCAEFAGQWFLINRQKAYDEEQPGEHDLITRLGSRIGFSSKWAMHVSEGSVEAPEGRFWQPALSKPSDARQEAREQQQAAREARADDDLEAARRSVIAVMVKLQRPAARSEVFDRVAIQKSRFGRAWASLADDGSIAEAGIAKRANGHCYPTYKVADA